MSICFFLLKICSKSARIACYHCSAQGHFGDECSKRARIEPSIFHIPILEYLQETLIRLSDNALKKHSVQKTQTNYYHRNTGTSNNVLNKSTTPSFGYNKHEEEGQGKRSFNHHKQQQHRQNHVPRGSSNATTATNIDPYYQHSQTKTFVPQTFTSQHEQHAANKPSYARSRDHHHVYNNQASHHSKSSSSSYYRNDYQVYHTNAADSTSINHHHQKDKRATDFYNKQEKAYHADDYAQTYDHSTKHYYQNKRTSSNYQQYSYDQKNKHSSSGNGTYHGGYK